MADVAAQFFLAYLKSQLVLLPILLFHHRMAVRSVGAAYRWTVHRIIVVAGLLLPLVFVLQVDVRVTEVSPLLLRARARLDEITAVAGITSMGTHAPLEVVSWPVRNEPVDEPGISPATGSVTATDGEPVEAFRRSLGASQAVSLMLLLLSAGGVIAFLVQILRQREYERRLRETARSVTRIGRLHVVVSHAVRVPFVAGLLRKRVYIPGYLEGGQNARKMVLFHEFTHIRLHHLFWSLLECFCSRLYWYNPLVHLLRKEGELIRELLCDRRAAKRFHAADYCRALVGVAEAGGPRRGAAVLAVPWTRRGSTRLRIERLLGEERRSSGVDRFSAFAVIAMSVAVFLLAGSCSESNVQQTAGAIPPAVSDAGRVEPSKPPADAAPAEWVALETIVEGCSVAVLDVPGGRTDGPDARSVAAELLATLSHRVRFLRDVYHRALFDDHSLRGNLVLSFTIGSDGTVDSASVQSTDITNTAFLGAVEEKTRNWVFREKAPSPPLRFSIPVRFGYIPEGLTKYQYAAVKKLQDAEIRDFLLAAYTRVDENESVHLCAGLHEIGADKLWDSLVRAGLESFFTVDSPTYGFRATEKRVSGAYSWAITFPEGGESLDQIREKCNHPRGTVILRFGFSEDGAMDRLMLIDSDVEDDDFMDEILQWVSTWRYSREKLKELLARVPGSQREKLLRRELASSFHEMTVTVSLQFYESRFSGERWLLRWYDSGMSKSHRVRP